LSIFNFIKASASHKSLYVEDEENYDTYFEISEIEVN